MLGKLHLPSMTSGAILSSLHVHLLASRFGRDEAVSDLIRRLSG
jgi:hypothetical protein